MCIFINLLILIIILYIKDLYNNIFKELINMKTSTIYIFSKLVFQTILIRYNI